MCGYCVKRGYKKIVWLMQKSRPPMAPRVLKLTKTQNLLGLKSSKRWSINERNTYSMKHFETNSQRFNYNYIYILSDMPATGCTMWYPCLVCKLTIFLIWRGWFAQDCFQQPPAKEPGDVPLLGEIVTRCIPMLSCLISSQLFFHCSKTYPWEYLWHPLAIKHSHGTSQSIDSSSNSL